LFTRRALFQAVRAKSTLHNIIIIVNLNKNNNRIRILLIKKKKKFFFKVEELNIRLRNLHIEDMVECGREEKRKVSKPPIFNGERKELKGFLTIVNMNFEDTLDDFPDDRSKVRFITSFIRGDPLNWVSNLWDNEDPLIDNLDNFKRELKINYGNPEVETIVANGKLDTIRQKKYGQVLEYINQFKTTCQNSDFNESAKIYMFLKGLHYKMLEQLAVVNPNPDSLNKLYTDVI